MKKLFKKLLILTPILNKILIIKIINKNSFNNFLMKEQSIFKPIKKVNNITKYHLIIYVKYVRENTPKKRLIYSQTLVIIHINVRIKLINIK